MLRFSLHRIIWVGSQITRSEGREDYSEVSYFFKDFSKFVPPAAPQKSGPKCAPASHLAPAARPGRPRLQRLQCLQRRQLITVLTSHSHRAHAAHLVTKTFAARLAPPRREVLPKAPSLQDHCRIAPGLGIRHCVAVSAHSQLSLVGVRGVASGAVCIWCEVAAGLMNLRWCLHKKRTLGGFLLIYALC